MYLISLMNVIICSSDSKVTTLIVFIFEIRLLKIYVKLRSVERLRKEMTMRHLTLIYVAGISTTS